MNKLQAIPHCGNQTGIHSYVKQSQVFSTLGICSHKVLAEEEARADGICWSSMANNSYGSVRGRSSMLRPMDRPLHEDRFNFQLVSLSVLWYVMELMVMFQ